MQVDVTRDLLDIFLQPFFISPMAPIITGIFVAVILSFVHSRFIDISESRQLIVIITIIIIIIIIIMIKFIIGNVFSLSLIG